MIRKLITIKPLKEKEKKLLKLLIYMVENSKAEQGCLKYELYEDSDGCYVLFEEWEDKECFEAHKQSEHFEVFAEKSPDLVKSKESRTLENIC